MRRRWVTAGLVLALAGVAAAQQAPHIVARPLIAAHRGGAALWPENSLAAFRGAIALGVDALEFDLHLTADDEVVVIHDATLERTTTGRGPVRSTPLAQLRTFRLLDATRVATGESVPTLAEVLDLARSTSMALLPEIKLDFARRAYPEIERRVVEQLRARGLFGRASVQSFDDATLGRVHALEPAVRTMLLVGRARMTTYGSMPADPVRWAVEAGAADLGIDFRLIDTRLVAAARAAGVRLAAWTVNTDDDLRRMGALGVAVVMSDRPDRARQLLVQP
jgi:glycerophosphoryl diester phosphodiesterase